MLLEVFEDFPFEINLRMNIKIFGHKEQSQSALNHPLIVPEDSRVRLHILNQRVHNNQLATLWNRNLLTSDWIELNILAVTQLAHY